ncbi:RING-H2 finger protein ATL78-like [Amaranthus tricolor]|uniref:RING-H2 finger protein ATL78-like n=1 Tax=Amaranthus tricolor TaxID=29722 RepID=UPI0025885E2C|nr:RING-H2 finger protein ATL78-like [Amaranthus tricolor]
MLPSTSSFTSNFPQELLTNLQYSRRLLLHTQAPSPTYQILDPTRGSTHENTGFDANIVMILAVLVCALVCSLCINTFIRCVIKFYSMIRGEPNYYLNMIDYDKKKISGLDKRALKTFPVVKYSKEVKIQGLSTECVICLSEFKTSEKIRVLPKCNHGFHVKCIDKWLSSHSSCPTCRQSLVDTCKKIIGCNDDHPHTSSSSPSSSSMEESREVIVVTILPLEREDLVRNYRGEVTQS